MNTLKSILLLSLLLCSMTLFAQTFSGGFFGGITTSQINGDENDGFHRIGGIGGFMVEWHNVQKPNNHSHVFGLDFSQKGSADAKHTFKITTGYVDACYLFQITPNFAKDFRFKIGGIASVKAYENLLVNGLKQKNDNLGIFDMQGCLGIDYHLLKTMSLDVQSSYSLFSLNKKYHNLVLYLTVRYYLVRPSSWK